MSRTSQASELPIKQFTIDSHYVPQHYLGAWSDDGVRVNAYRLVVPNERVVVWKPRAIRGLVKHQHLYTSMLTGEASDEFERWIEREVETPGAEAIDKVRANRRLSPSDWRKLSYYLAALDRRTPAAFLDHLKFYDDNMPSVIENVMAGLRARIAAGQKFQIPREGEPPQPLRHGDFPLFVSTVRDRESGQLNLHVEVLSGREMWLYDLRRAITQLARVLTNHRWFILTPPPGQEWMTSDHPVVRLNYYGPGQYDFGGGWNNKGTEIMLPLSPKHLFFTKIGSRGFRNGEATPEIAAHVHRFIVQRAHRWVLARTPRPDVTALRPRRVDREQYLAETREWSEFHAKQASAVAEALAKRHAVDIPVEPPNKA